MHSCQSHHMGSVKESVGNIRTEADGQAAKRQRSQYHRCKEQNSVNNLNELQKDLSPELCKTLHKTLLSHVMLSF